MLNKISLRCKLFFHKYSSWQEKYWFEEPVWREYEFRQDKKCQLCGKIKTRRV